MNQRKFAVGLLLAACCAILVAAGGASASTIITLTQQDYASLGVTGTASDLTVSPYSYNLNTFTGDVISRAYTLSSGNYLYLYQARNDGPAALEVLGINPVYQLLSAGYLTGTGAADVPSGFLGGGVAPILDRAAYDATLIKPNLSYGYPATLGADLVSGQHTKVFFIVSSNAPTVGEGYVIDSGSVVVPTVVALPEPMTMGLVGVGLGGLLMVRRGRRSAR